MAENRELKRLPYGKANFSVIRQHNFAYVDKTRYIEALEQYGTEFSFIVRPRRFGKTLFTSTLEAYYDEFMAKDFEKNFAGTYIGTHKTPLASSFRTIHFDFSGIALSEHIDKEFLLKIRDSIQIFFDKYPHPRQEEILGKDYSSAASLVGAFLSLMAVEYAQKIYVIIDEFDQLPNDILSSDAGHLKEITSKEGYYKAFFTRIKEATANAVARVFITGVSSFSLDSVTSGFNIARNFTTHPAFAGMFGFSEAELRELVLETVDLKACELTLDDVISDMKEWYNGYRFSTRSEETVFNSTMCLYYLRNLKTIHEKPDTLIDSNLGYDLNKIEGYLNLGSRALIKETLESAMNHAAIAFKSTPSDLNLNRLNNLNQSELLSVMFYLGFLTYDSGKTPALVIPNRAIQSQFFVYYLEHIVKAQNYEFDFEEFVAVRNKLAQGDYKPLFNFVCNRFNSSSNLHSYAHLQEGEFQVLLFTAFLLTGLYNVRREVEIEGEVKGYADLVVTPKEPYATLPTYLVEFKYVAKSDASKELIEKIASEAKEQLNRYADGENMRTIPNLKKILCVFVGLHLEHLEELA